MEHRTNPAMITERMTTHNMPNTSMGMRATTTINTVHKASTKGTTKAVTITELTNMIMENMDMKGRSIQGISTANTAMATKGIVLENTITARALCR